MIVRVLALTLVLLLAGCGSDDSDESEPEAVGTEIALRDFLLMPPNAELDDAGTATFTVVNDGQTTHALEIEGQGVEEETELLEPGETAELTVDLEEGDYEMYCPVDGHRAQGMEGTLIVGAGSAGSPSGGTDTGEDDDDNDDGGYPYGG